MPHCALCERETGETPPTPPPRPDPMPPTHRRPRTVDTSRHFCPHTECDYRGWLGMNNLRANGHPNGSPWRQLHCTACEGYFPEHHGTIFYGKQAAVELIVHVLACLAEGLGIRATARVFEVDANTVLHWLIEAAEHLRAFSAYFLCDLHVKQLQLDELYAVLSAVKDGEITEAKAITRLSRSPQWVWVAMDPESKLLLTIEVGDRTLAMAQRVVHHVAQVLAPDCAPLFVTDGFREYMTALLTHYGYWLQPPRRQVTGPKPKPRWMPLPQLLYAQVVKTVRRHRLVRRDVIAWCLARWRRSMTCWRRMAGTSIPPSWSASTSPSGSTARRNIPSSAPPKTHANAIQPMATSLTMHYPPGDHRLGRPSGTTRTRTRVDSLYDLIGPQQQ